MARIALYFHPEAYSITGPKLMGRNAAGESFLRGFLAHIRTDAFWVQVQNIEHARHFAHTVKALGRNEPIKVVENNNLGPLAQAGTVYHPGPGIGEHAWRRAAFGHGAWSLCGITHTTSSARAMDAITNLLTDPVYPWDALIATSKAVRSNLETVLKSHFDYLKYRLGVTNTVLPQLPVIPLGVHTRDFSLTSVQKAQARNALGIDTATLVVLFMGRLSFHAKAHPLAMYQALETASKATGKDIVLVECGWHANDHIARAFGDAARLACPSVRVVMLDGRKPADRQIAWAVADVFCSLSDNIQETFGLAPIEAMAAGLPVVVSDWDGYKDTVRDGIDGFRIPTLMPRAGLGGDLALRHALEIDTYDMYCGYACSLVAVDVAATAHAFQRLFLSLELRKQMGEAGRQRARDVYDWAAVIPQYEALWEELSAIRTSHAMHLTSLPHPWPARMDPFHAFATYPTRDLTEQTMLGLVDSKVDIALRRALEYLSLAMIDFAKLSLPSETEIEKVLKAASTGPKAAVELVADLQPERQAFVFRSLVWLVKLGVLRIVP